MGTRADHKSTRTGRLLALRILTFYRILSAMTLFAFYWGKILTQLYTCAISYRSPMDIIKDSDFLYGIISELSDIILK
jgi:hypothetical protein